MIPESLRNILRSIGSKRQFRDTIRLIESIKYRDWRVWDHKGGNRCIYEALRSGRPHAIGKLGSAEVAAIRQYLRYRSHPDRTNLTAQVRRELFVNAGVFPDNYETFGRFCEYMLQQVLPQVTMMAVWFNFQEAAIVKTYCQSPRLISLYSLAGYMSALPWTRALQHRRVLVLHPFMRSIEQQFQKRRQLWGYLSETLPDFKLEVIAVPQSPALVPPRNKDWFESLTLLQDEMARTHFDVALIGAGAYSLPLAVHAKKLGKQGIHLGGETQFLFGIKGGRWDNMPECSKHYNQYWIRPLPEDTPAENKVIENGCYW